MKSVVGTFVVLVVALASAGAHAQVLDHLLCYRIKDPLVHKSTVKLLAELQPEFSAACVVSRSLEFCVPVTKDPTHPPHGQTLKDDYICYLSQCDSPDLPPRLVVDQFGRREIGFHKAYKLCVPAQKLRVPKPCGGVVGGTCEGDCPNAGEVCTFDSLNNDCACVHPCGPDASGACNGFCPEADQICAVDSAGNCMCNRKCQPDAAGLCGGVCPPDRPVCRQTDAGCACF